MCKFTATFSQLTQKISSRKNKIIVGSLSQMSHILLNHLSVQQSQIVTFSFLQLSGTWHLCVYRFMIQNLKNTLDRYLQKFMSQFYEICKGYIFPYEILQEDLLTWKVYYKIYFFFYFLHLFLWMSKFLIRKNIFLPRLVKRESCRSSHCILQSF